MTPKPKVLLVDDDVGFLKATSLVLAQAGYEVFTATDGPGGLAAAREHKPDVAVVDVIMNRPDEGFRLARAIRADEDLAAVKLLILTAVGRRYDMLFEPDEQWLPVDKVLEKPASGDELAGEISALLRGAAQDEDRT
jgi:DNA-binding response OmpR family regulator